MSPIAHGIPGMAFSKNPPFPLPRLPMLSWRTFSGGRQAQLPCLLDRPRLQLTTSGRASILLALESLQLKPGDRVLVPTYHCPTMIAPVSALDLEPVFYPIDHAGSVRMDWLESQSLAGIRVLLAAHYFGLPQSMSALRAWCDQHGIFLIEDCAHALFGTSDDRPIGSWGDIAIGSLTKFLPVSEGGCLQVNVEVGHRPSLDDPSILQQIKAAVDIAHAAADHDRLSGLNAALRGLFSLRDLVRRRPAPPSSPFSGAADASEPIGDGFTVDIKVSHRAPTWISSWMARRTPRARIVERRRHHFNRMIRLLAGHEDLHPLHSRLPDGAAPYVFPLWVKEPDPGYSTLRKMGIPISRWDWLWPSTPSILTDFGQEWSHHVLQLACHQDLSDAEVDTIAAAVVAQYSNSQPPRTERSK